jgi:uncharacterized membrane protein YcaP (DUF421 family)
MEIVVRVAIIYVFLMLGLRVIGKREFGQLTPFELVTLLLIPEIVTKALTGQDYSLTAAFIGVSTLLVLVFLTSLLAYRFPSFGRFTEGRPALLAREGALVPATLHRERVSPDEIRLELHKYGLEEWAQVKWALLEVDGSITLVPWMPEEADIKRDQKELP